MAGREVAAETIGKIGLNTASQTLIEAMEDEYWQVRVKAAQPRSYQIANGRSACHGIDPRYQQPP